jgi:hypothetical protein
VTAHTEATITLTPEEVFGEFAQLERWVGRLRRRQCPNPYLDLKQAIVEEGAFDQADSMMALRRADGIIQLVSSDLFNVQADRRPMTDDEHMALLMHIGIDVMAEDALRDANGCRDLDGDRVDVGAQRWLGEATPVFCQRRLVARIFTLEAKVEISRDTWGFLIVRAWPRFGLVEGLTLCLQPSETGNGIPLWVAMGKLFDLAMHGLELMRQGDRPIANRAAKRRAMGLIR